MTRNQSTQVFNQGMANSKQDQGNAQTALGGAEQGLSDYNSRLSSYYSNDPYKTGGQFQSDQTMINSARAGANAASLREALNNRAIRSGENTASYAPTLAMAQRIGTIDTATAQAQSDAQRLSDETRYQQYGLEASKFPVTANEGLYSTSLSGANQALNTAGSAAANNRSFGDTFGSALAGQLPGFILGTAQKKIPGLGGGGGGGGGGYG